MHLATESRPQVRRDRLLRLPEVESLTGLKKSTIYHLMKQTPPGFPRCVQVTPRCVAWPESRCLEWVQEKIREAGLVGGGASEGSQGQVGGGRSGNRE